MAVRTTVNGVDYVGFVKRRQEQFGGFINQLILLEDQPGLTQTVSPDILSDEHLITGLRGSERVYYLLFITPNFGGEVADSLFEDIVVELVEGFSMEQVPYITGVSPESGTLAPGEEVELTVSIDTSGLLGGFFETLVEFSTNDPLRPTLLIPVELDLTGIPQAIPTPSSLELRKRFSWAIFQCSGDGLEPWHRYPSDWRSEFTKFRFGSHRKRSNQCRAWREHRTHARFFS